MEGVIEAGKVNGENIGKCNKNDLFNFNLTNDIAVHIAQ